MEKGIILCGEFRECKNNIDILKETVDWLIDKGLLSNSDAPLIKRRKRYVINNEPVHSDGTDFSNGEQLSKVNLHLEKNWNSKDIKEISKNLLEEYDINTEALHIVEVKEVNSF